LPISIRQPHVSGDGGTYITASPVADVRWLNAAFKLAGADNAHNVVIIGQAEMWDTTDAPSHALEPS